MPGQQLAAIALERRPQAEEEARGDHAVAREHIPDRSRARAGRHGDDDAAVGRPLEGLEQLDDEPDRGEREHERDDGDEARHERPRARATRGSRPGAGADRERRRTGRVSGVAAQRVAAAVRDPARGSAAPSEDGKASGPEKRGGSAAGHGASSASGHGDCSAGGDGTRSAGE